MLSKAHGEDSGIRTVTLPRGSVIDPSPGPQSNAPRRPSVDKQPLEASFGRVSTSGSSLILEESGIVELLEQDWRPTFIVDIAEGAKVSPGKLHLVYANPALKSNPAWPELVNETAVDSSSHSSPTTRSPKSPGEVGNYAQFKNWILSATSRRESRDACLTSFLYGGVVWSCSMIKRRLRVISASSTFSNVSSRTRSFDSTSHTVTSGSSVGLTAAKAEPTSSFAEKKEPPDYFGDVAPPPKIKTSTRGHSITKVGEQDDLSSAPAVYPPNASTRAEMNRSPLPAELVNATDLHPSPGAELVLGSNVASTLDPFVDSSTSSLRLPSNLHISGHSSSHQQGFFDWTQLPLSRDLPPHIQFARSIKWEETALGHIDQWPTDLRQMCNLIMASPHPAAMYWGDDLVAIYNEAYVLLAGQKHPRLMGQRYREAWAEIWDDVKDVFASARLTGEATMKDNDRLFIKRSDYLEETYFSWSIIPMVGSDGSVAGLYNPAFEKTRRKIAERRMLTLREVGERTSTARDVKGFWKQVAAALEENDLDTPFVLLYSVADESEGDSNSIHSSSLTGTKQCYLEGSLGVPPNHPVAPAQSDLKEGNEGFVPVFREVVALDKPVLLDVTPDGRPLVTSSPPHTSTDSGGIPHSATGQIPERMLDGVDFRGFGDRCRSVVVCPVHPTTGESILGFLVLGVNPRRPYDDDYHLFVQLLSRQLATSLASVVLFEEEIRRGQKAAKLAALDRIELSQQLAARTREARDIETRFTRMAEFSPAGLFIADSQGHITYCNDTWYEITRVPRDTHSTDRWIDAVKEEDQELVRNNWHHLIHNVRPVTVEFRFKAQWQDRNGNRSDTWVLFSAYPEKYTEDVFATGEEGKLLNIEGSLKSVFGSVTNISQQKWAEGFQKHKMEEAVELKRQQENFIDITSHEMRNPLSAILQCTDEISTTLSSFQSSVKDGKASEKSADLMEALETAIDAAQTIALCSQHQKRIVDDVLTLSKLDSAMLMVTPVDVQPIEVVQRALKMFEGEVATANIDMRFIVDASFRKLGIDWVRIDPSRVLQVLINLTTNAIKFTSTEAEGKKRSIVVTIAASLTRPSKLPADQRVVDYFPTRNSSPNILEHPDWAGAEEVYVNFAVQDTGRGLAEDEKKMLFLRFSQASPRTHVQYGGSGLGLFISRELTELQGGEIGVSSESGKGSTFAFYVKARRSRPPKDFEHQKHEPGVFRRPSHLDRSRESGASLVRSRDFASRNVEPAAVVAIKEKPRSEIKVLIVEDNLVNQKVLQKQLKKAGFVVSVANHGGECLDVLRETGHCGANVEPPAVVRKDSESKKRIDANTDKIKQFNVVLMDQEMPVMNGVSCTKQIRKWEAAGEVVRHLPIIAVTANARKEQVESLLAAGMDDVVSKPFRIPELVPKIEELAAKYPVDAPSV